MKYWEEKNNCTKYKINMDISIEKKALLVDDSERFLTSFKLWISKQGFITETAENAAEALEKIPEFKPDLIISDMRMPGMNGVELMNNVNIEGGYFPGKIIFTAFDDGEAFEIANIAEGGTFRVEKDRWEIDLRSAIARSLELSKMCADAWKKGQEIAKLTTIHTLAVTLGHEINNPLQSISMANQVSVKKYGQSSTSKTITENVSRIKDVTGKLTNLSEIKEIKYAGGDAMININ